jgi:ferric-dicitrate binding protein FerR (iron transport regulator)
MDTFEHFTDIIHKYLASTADKEDLISLLEWLKRNSENVNYFNQLCNIWELSSNTGNQKIEAELALSRLNKRINELDKIVKPAIMQSETRIWKFRFAAAVFIGIIAISSLTYVIYHNNLQSTDALITNIEAIAPPSQKSQLILSDGTKVWLNSGTKLRYSSNYGIQNREVFLEGEAYFHVVKNPAKPFIVHASSIIVKALGTSFNVKCYASDTTIETTLVEGRVQVFKTKEGMVKSSKVFLNPNEKAVFTKRNEEIFIDRYEDNQTLVKLKSKSPVYVYKTVQSDISWTEQRLVFENETFEDLTKRLERWYNINIHISDETLKGNRYTGKFVNNESIEQVLQIIAKTTPIHYSIKDDNITIDTKQ